jgi:outer membrane lipoprotein-sorting protein
MISFLRRISLARLLVLCASTVAIAIGSAAIALAVSAGPTPPPKPLADAIHAAFQAPPPSGISARIELVNHLFEGSEVEAEASGGTGHPLLDGGTGRLWVGDEGRLRLELQSEGGATQILLDGRTITLYDASRNTLYRYTLPEGEAEAEGGQAESVPTVNKIEEELTRLMGQLDIGGATPTDVAGQPAYSATVAPKRHAGLLGDAELAWDAHNGVPLRFAIYAKGNPSPAIELTVSEISFGAVPASIFSLALPANVRETTIKPAMHRAGAGGALSAQTSGLAAVEAAVPFELRAPQALAGL